MLHKIKLAKSKRARSTNASIRGITMMASWYDANPLEEEDLRIHKKATSKKNEDSALARKRAFLNLGVATNFYAKLHDDSDVAHTRSKDKALRLLKGLILDAIVDDKQNSEKWNFTTVPLKCYNKTMDDVLVAFLQWAKTEDENPFYNVSKAFARVQEYATWMHARRDDLRGLTNESIQRAWNAWNIKVSHDKEGRVVSWVDLASVGDIKELTAKDSLCLFVWFAHYLVFRHQTKQNGIVVVVNMARVDLRSFVSMLPPSLGLKLEQLAKGILPIKIEQIYMIGSPKWCNVFMTMIKTLLSQYMRRRAVVLESPTDLDEVVGPDCVPEGFGRCMSPQVSPHSAEVPLVSEEQGTLLRPTDVRLISREHGTLLREWQ